MDNYSSFGDETGEIIAEQGGTAVKKVIGGVVGAVKQQVFNSSQLSNTDEKQEEGHEVQGKKAEAGSGKKSQKLDPVTGKPIPSKKILTQLNQQVAQLAQARLKKVREELAKQRLKTSDQVPGSSGQKAQGPEIKQEQPKEKENIIQKTLKGSKSTGEFKGLIGG